jgi:hypothetical protein
LLLVKGEHLSPPTTEQILVGLPSLVLLWTEDTVDGTNLFPFDLFMITVN